MTSTALPRSAVRAFRTPAPLSVWVRMLLGLTAAFSLLAIVSDYQELSLLSRVIAGEPVAGGDVAANDHRQARVALAQLLLMVPTAALFIAWLHRVYSNLDSFGAKRRFGTGWAIGAWFVPVLNLVRPASIVYDAWRGCHAERAAARGGGLVVWWWAFFLASGLVAQAGARIWSGAETPEAARLGTEVVMLSDAVSLAAALAGFLLVSRLTALQEGRAAETMRRPAFASASAHAPRWTGSTRSAEQELRAAWELRADPAVALVHLRCALDLAGEGAAQELLEDVIRIAGALGRAGGEDWVREEAVRLERSATRRLTG